MDPAAHSSERVGVLDGWRGLAILIVVMHNAGLISYSLAGDPEPAMALLNTVLASGWVGVQLFFVLSGFLITGILVDTRGSERYFRSFYLRRTLRIFPVYYLFMALVTFAAWTPMASEAWAATVRADLLWYWTYLSNWKPLLEYGPDGLGHLWSLGVEEQFYLVWPLLVVVAGRRFPFVVGAVLVLAPLSRAAMLAAGLSPEYLYYFTNARADALALGAGLALVVRREDWNRALLHRAPLLLVLATVGLVPVTVASTGFGQSQVPVLLFGQTLIAVWFGCLMFVSLEPRTPAQRALTAVLERPWLRGMGRYSYAVYVFHYPMSQYLIPRVAPLLGVMPLGARVVITLVWGLLILALSLGLARISWVVLERPSVRLKDRIAPRAGWAPAG